MLVLILSLRLVFMHLRERDTDMIHEGYNFHRELSRLTRCFLRVKSGDAYIINLLMVKQAMRRVTCVFSVFL